MGFGAKPRFLFVNTKKSAHASGFYFCPLKKTKITSRRTCVRSRNGLRRRVCAGRVCAAGYAPAGLAPAGYAPRVCAVGFTAAENCFSFLPQDFFEQLGGLMLHGDFLHTVFSSLIIFAVFFLLFCRCLYLTL